MTTYSLPNPLTIIYQIEMSEKTLSIPGHLSAKIPAAVIAMLFALCAAFGSAAQNPQQSVVAGDLEYTVSRYYPDECSVRITPLYEASDSGYLLPVPRKTEGPLNISAKVKICGTYYRVTEIEWGAFENHTFESITLPQTITEVGHLAFGHTKGFFEIPGSVDVVGHYAFAGSTGKVKLEEGVRVISDNAFGGFVPDRHWCASEAIVIPSTVEFVGRTILGTDLDGDSDAGFSEIQCFAAVPPEVEEGPDGECDLCTLSSSYERILLYVPDRSLSAYRSAPGWSKFKSIQPLSKSGIDHPVVSDPITIEGREGCIVILCEDPSPLPVKIYSPDGRQIYFGNSRSIPLAPGLYLVRASSTTAKIHLQ